MTINIEIFSYESEYKEKITKELEFNEEIDTIAKLLSFLGYSIEHVATKHNGISKNVSKKNHSTEIKNNFSINNNDNIELFLIPSAPDFYFPTLKFFSDCEEHKLKEIKKHNCDYFKFPKEVIEEKTYNDVLVHHSRSDMAKQDLLYKNLINNVERGKFKITNKGLRFLENFNNHFKERDMKNFFSFEFDEYDGNKIFFGAPGTGKSFKLREDMMKIIKGYDSQYERVTFHPEYSYANFVGTYKPIPKDDNSITYEYVPGPFMRILKKAIYSENNEPFFLIIEEINRANVAAVFGDIFQLLDRNEFNDSEYEISTSRDMKNYLEDTSNNDFVKIDYDFDKIKIPSNMFIWATMNSADQGVFPMDTAFKRRWNFEYINIDNNQDKIKEIGYEFNGEKIYWNDLRKAINNRLLSYKINEDKLMGPFFAFKEFIDNEDKLSDKKFIEIFKNKIIMYLFEDVAKRNRGDLFEGSTKGENVIYSKVCDDFDKLGVGIFHESISNQFLNDNGD